MELKFGEEYINSEIEVEIISSVKFDFLTYKGKGLIRQYLIEELDNFEPSRWAVEELNNGLFRTYIQGYHRNMHLNSGCSSQEFQSGICEDPHILTIGGNRLDLPHDNGIYNMIEGLGLRINVKCQLLGNGSYAKYYYINYNNDEIIIDIESLEMKNYKNKLELKHHLLRNEDYIGNEFVIKKKLRSLIIKSIDGNLELLLNAETRGLLIKSKHNFTQENSTGILMSSPVDECRIDDLKN